MDSSTALNSTALNRGSRVTSTGGNPGSVDPASGAADGMRAPRTHRNVLVVVDPALDNATAALDLAVQGRSEAPARLTVLVSLSGAAADPLRELALRESIAIAQAAGIYLARMAAELAAKGVIAEMMSIPGLDPVVEIATCAVEINAAMIVAPEGSDILDAAQTVAVAALAGAPVLAVPGSHPPGRQRRAA